ncbi:hypothetical protein AVEN_97138-1, partial [Araneus ventricosus]
QVLPLLDRPVYLVPAARSSCAPPLRDPLSRDPSPPGPAPPGPLVHKGSRLTWTCLPRN